MSFERVGEAVTFTRLNSSPSGRDWPCHFRLDPSGKWLTVSNYGPGTVSAVFAATPEGELTRWTLAGCGGNWPRNFAIAPDGRFILVANQYGGEVVSLPLLPAAGEIGAPVARVAVPNVACVVFTPEVP